MNAWLTSWLADWRPHVFTWFPHDGQVKSKPKSASPVNVEAQREGSSNGNGNGNGSSRKIHWSKKRNHRRCRRSVRCLLAGLTTASAWKSSTRFDVVWVIFKRLHTSNNSNSPRRSPRQSTDLPPHLPLSLYLSLCLRLTHSLFVEQLNYRSVLTRMKITCFHVHINDFHLQFPSRSRKVQIS